MNESSSDKSTKSSSSGHSSVSSIKHVQPGHFRPEAIGEQYSAEERKKRQAQMEKLKKKRNPLKEQMVRYGNESAPNIHPIIDSHFYYDRLQA